MKKMPLHRAVVLTAWLAGAPVFAQAALPSATDQNVTVDFHEANKMIVLGQSADNTYRILISPSMGTIRDINNNLLGVGAIVSKDGSDRAIIYYSQSGYTKVADPDYIPFEVEDSSGHRNAALVEVDLNLQPSVALYSVDPQSNPGATPLATGSTFVTQQQMQIDTTQLPSSTSDSDYITIWAKASDITGREAMSSAQYLIDNIPPTLNWVQVPADNAAVHGSVQFKLSASDNLGPAGVQQVRFRPPLAVVDTLLAPPISGQPWQTTYDTTQIAPDGHYPFHFEAVDRASLVSAPLDKPLNVDNTPPTLGNISIPDNITVLNLTNLSADVSGGAIVILIDGNPAPATFSAPNIYTLNQPLTDTGNHIVTVEAIDTAGNVVDKTIHVTIGTPNPIDNDPQLNADFSNTGPGLSGTSLLNLHPTDDNGVTGVTVSIDNKPAQPATPSGNGDYQYVLNTAPLSDGNHTVTVEVTDTGGHKHDETTTINIDNTPFMNVPGLNTGDTLTGTKTIDVTPVAGTTLTDVKVFVDGTLVSDVPGSGPFNIPWETTSASDGPHDVTVRGTDTLGNQNTVTKIVTVDNIPNSPTDPVVEATQFPGNHVGGDVTLRLTNDDTLTNVQFVIDGNPINVPTNPSTGHHDYDWNTGGLADGDHTVMSTYLNNNIPQQTPIVHYIVDNSPPSITVLLPSQVDMDLGLYGPQVFRVSAQDAGNRPIDHVDFILGGQKVALVPGHDDPANTTYEFVLDTLKLKDTSGNQRDTLIAIAYDKAGNPSTNTGVYIFKVNNTNPPSAGHIMPHPANNAFVVSDEDSAIYATFDGAALNTDELTKIGNSALTVFVTKDGQDYSLPGTSTYDGTRLTFNGKIPDNAKVRWSINVHDTSGKQYTATNIIFTRAMARSSGGSVTTADRRFKIDVPANALPQDMLVTVVDEQQTSGIVNPALGNFQSVNPGQTVVAGPFDVQAVDKDNVVNMVIQKSASCSYNVPPAEDDLNSPKVFQLAELFDNGKVFPLGSAKSLAASAQADPGSNKTINVPISRFGRFVITSQVVPEAGLTHFYNFPNPFNPNQGGTDFHYFLGADSSVKIMIYDLFGHQVRGIDIPMGGTGGKVGLNLVTWDGKNGVGLPVANGGYIAHVFAEDNQGRRTKASYKIGVLK